MLATTEGLCTATKRFWRSAVWATVAAAVLCIGSAAWAQQQTAADPNSPALRLIKIIPINGTAGNRATQMFSFDISWWDPTTGLYFLADRSNAALDVIDTTGAFTGTADTLYGQIGGPTVGFAGDTGTSGTSGPNGVTVSPNPSVPCIFATDTFSAATNANTSGRVVSFNYNTSFTTVVSSINTGGTHRADELAFDPKDNLILAINNADTPPFGTLISVSSTCALSIKSKITFTTANGVNATNGAEQPVWQPSTQRFFVSIPEVDGDGSGAFPKGAVAQINTSGTIEGLYQVNYCQPAGLSNNPNTGDLLVGCNSVFDLSATPISTNHKCTAVVPSACLASTTPGTCTSFSGNGAPATCLNGLSGAQEVICNPGRGCTTSNGSIVSVPGAGGGDEVWFNSGDGNYYATAGNNPGGPVVAVIASVSGTGTTNVLTQLVPTLEPTPAVTSIKRSAGTAHSIAASVANPSLGTQNHVYVPLPANNSYQLNGAGCAQGCIAVFSAQ
jgi:hypothetical protein